MGIKPGGKASFYIDLKNIPIITLAVNSTSASVLTEGNFTIVYNCLYALTISFIPLTLLSPFEFTVSFASCLNTAMKVVVTMNTHPQSNKKLPSETRPVSSGMMRMYLLQKYGDSNARNST